MNPVLDLPVLIPILVVLIGLGIFASWRSSHHASAGLRKLLLLLRIVALSCLAVFFLNPGKWVDKSEQQTRLYPIMIDDSASMATTTEKVSRSDVARDITKLVQTEAGVNKVQTKLYSFSDDLKNIDDLLQLSMDGKQSNIHRSGANLFTKLQASGESPEAVIMLTDGRQTATVKHSTLALQSRANNAPIYAVSIGSEVLRKDLTVATARNTITAFPEQNIQITAVIRNHNLGNQSVVLTLVDNSGKELSRQELEIEDNKKILHSFSIKAPEKSIGYKLIIDKANGEQDTDNNTSRVNVRILNTKTRVFIAEGAPYWDSKFLAQLLRQQGHMDVHSVHRLSDERWFRIDSGQSAPTASSNEVFPDTAEELSRYDLIIFGKNSEHFLTSQRIEALKAYVRDQGGAVLFSRGKPYSSRLESLEALEPVTWASGNTSAFNIAPTADGQSAGLFGQALPAPNSPIWQSLPSLKDAHSVDSVKPFTRVLAEGSLPGSKGKFPLLLVRRYGQGVSGLVNADGLWKWDFYPEARELGNMYQEFWTQLIQWMVAYSEFLPGHDYSLHASNQIIAQDETIVFSLSYRGAKKASKPTITITADGKEPVTLTPASSTAIAGKPTWKCSYVPTSSGTYLASVNTDDKSPSPAINIEVKAPPTEMDNLNPDPDYLSELCESTGGRLLTVEELPTFLKQQFSQQSTRIVKSETVWESSWMKWFIPIIVLLILATEWWVRRRSGLI